MLEEAYDELSEDDRLCLQVAIHHQLRTLLGISPDSGKFAIVMQVEPGWDRGTDVFPRVHQGDVVD